jgi:hypothetical protein
MNRKQFLLMLMAVAVLGGAGLAMFWQELSGYKESGARIGAKVLPNLRAADATEIRLKDAKNEVTLVSQKGSWSVKERGGYPADVGEISELLAKLVEAKIVQSEAVGESLYPRLNLGEPGKEKGEAKGEGAGTLLELKDKDGKPIAKLIFGKVSLKKDPGNPLPNAVDGVPAGRYMIAPGKIGSVVVVSDPFANVDAKAGKWLAKNFFKAERIKTLTVGEGAAQWKITRELEYSQWKFAAGAGQLDPSAAVGAVNALGQLAFSDVSTEAKVESKVAGEKVTTIVAETFDNLAYTIKVAKQKTGDDYLFNFVLTGEPPKTRAPEKDEKPDEIARRAKEYVDTLKRLEARAQFEKILGQWVYVMPGKSLEPMLKDRAQMVVQPRKPDDGKGVPPGFAR